MDFVYTSTSLSLLHHFQELNFSSPCPCAQSLNATIPASVSPPAFGMSYFTMTLGALSNLTALGILAKSCARFRRRAKAPFLLLVGTLLLVDLAGQVITGAFALHLHLERARRQRAEGRIFEPPQAFCQLFGACMVFFGLCPLLLGSAMAVERCMGITQPLLHSALVTVARARLAVLLLSSLALLLAVLPLLDVGSYAPQFPGTWCFLPLHGPLSTADAGLALAFSGLGLAALALSVLCNATSVLALLQARLASRGFGPSAARQRGPSGSSSSALNSLDVEMMTQLAVITVVSCVCWSPFLIYISVSVGQFYDGAASTGHRYEQLLLLGLRMASWNQILDPWVYILLRRAVLRRVCLLLQPDKPTFSQSGSCTDPCRQKIRFH